MKKFNEIIDQFLDIVIQDPAIESAWISALSHLEELAAQQIRGNISAFTPEAEREAILAHAADEDRHCVAIQALRPIAELTDPRYQELERHLRLIAKYFIVGYFGNPLLITARNKHAAYVHGAMTIEQFPFQIYTAYLKKSQLPQVKEQLPTIIKEEYGHLQLGKNLRELLPEDQHISVDQLQEIEKDMVLRMVERMDLVVRRFVGLEPDTDLDTDFAEFISSNEDTTIAWTYVIGHAESRAAQEMQKVFSLRSLPQPDEMGPHVDDEMRHSKMLQRTVLIQRRQLTRDPAYSKIEQGMLQSIDIYLNALFAYVMKKTDDPELIYRYGALALETRVFKHYKLLEVATDHIGLAHVLGVVLDDESAHTAAAQKGLLARNPDPSLARELRDFEQMLFDRTCRKIRAVITDARQATQPGLRRARAAAAASAAEASPAASLTEAIS